MILNIIYKPQIHYFIFKRDLLHIMNSPKISIIVPVYNVEKFLERCLNSLINQSLQNIEIICINDGSKDSSQKILEDFARKDKRIIVINQENKGLSAARNRGLEKVSGEYIGFVDSDDWVDLDFFEKLYNAAKNNDCDMAASGMIRIKKFDKKFHLKFEKETITDNPNLKFALCDVPDMSYLCNKIYRKEFWMRNNFQFEEGIIYEDVILFPQILFYSNKLVTVPDTYYYYWRHSNTLVRNKSKKANKDSEYAHKKALEFIKEHNIDISSHEPVTKKYKFLGMTILKIRKKGNKQTTSLFNIIKW